jgi:hydrogenase nickel incorporation protein HypA/HybF
MHELAIAKSLIDTAVAQLPASDLRIGRLRVQLGALAGVSIDELTFGFEVMSQDTPCANAQLEIEEIAGVIHCPACEADFTLAEDDDLLCPHCGTPAVKVIQGKELLLTSIEVYQEALHA